MKTNVKKILASVLIFSLGILSSGCEKKDSSNEGKVTKLRIWGTESEVDVLKVLGHEFTTVPENSGISTHYVIFESDEELQEFLIDQMAEGKGPDVVYINGNWVYRNKEKIISLKDDDSLSPGKFKEIFVRSAVATLVRDDEVLGVPLGVDSIAVFYNEDHLSSAIFDRNGPGRTWGVFRDSVEELTMQDNSFERFAISGAAIGRVDNLNYGFEILENIMVQMGTDFYSNDEKNSKIASSVGVSKTGKRENFGEAALNFFVSFADQRADNFSWSEFMASSLTEEKEIDAFVEGRISMIFGTSKDFERIKELIDKRKKVGKKVISRKSVRVAFLPQIQDPNVSHTRDVVAKLRVLSVPVTSPIPKIAWRFLKFASKKDNLKSFHDRTQIPTPHLGLVPEQEAEPGIGIFVRQAKFAEPNLSPLSVAELKVGLSEAVLQVNEGKLSVLNALKMLEKQLTKRLKSLAQKRNMVERQEE